MILVTGATGFLGKRLCEILHRDGKAVFPLSSANGDIAGTEWWATVPKDNIEHVFHCAGQTFVPRSWSDPLNFIRVNSLGTGSVLEFCRDRKIPVTYVSAYVYGSEVKNPISEESVPHPNNPYALSKRFGEELCEFYAASFSLDISIVRPFNIFGPGQDETFLIPYILKQVMQGQEIRVKDLLPRRDYIYVDDVISCLSRTIGKKGFNIYNAGTGVSTSVQELIEQVQAIAGTKLPVISENIVRSNEISDTVADITKAKELLNWKPLFTLKDGISRIFEREYKQS